MEAKQNNAEENDECGTGNRHTGLIIPQVRNQDTGKRVKRNTTPRNKFMSWDAFYNGQHYMYYCNNDTKACIDS